MRCLVQGERACRVQGTRHAADRPRPAAGAVARGVAAGKGPFSLFLVPRIGSCRSTQLKVLSTAFFQSPNLFCLSSGDMAGSHVLSWSVPAKAFKVRPETYGESCGICRPERCRFVILGRMTGTFSKSAWNCMRSSLVTMPPSTLRLLKATPESWFMLSTMSLV